MNNKTHIGLNPPKDGKHYECQCARCGSSLGWEPCGACGGDGYTAPGELYELDPLWYDQEDIQPCHQCGGEGSFPVCLSSPDWCEAHPMAGRESIPRHMPEWFPVEIAG